MITSVELDALFENLLTVCSVCDKIVNPEMYCEHIKMCKQDKQPEPRKKTQSKKTQKTVRNVTSVEVSNLNQVQKRAVEYCIKKARIYHKNVYPNSLIRFMELGFTEQDMIDTLDYIKNCDVIVHFRSEANWIKTEQTLKNAYEVNRDVSYLTSRTDWENSLFLKIYGDPIDDQNKISRVKYGCVNLLSDPLGCPTATGYGTSYMILKPSLKSRISFVCGDSANKQQHICTFDNCVQLLLYMDVYTLKNVIMVARIKKQKNQNGYLFKLDKDDEIRIKQMNRSYNYVEVQIHGDVVLTKDVERVVLDDAHYDKGVCKRLESDDIPYVVLDRRLEYYPTFL